MTDLRELFEEQFPVPKGAIFDPMYQEYYFHRFPSFSDAHYNAKWIGFLAGYEAGKEGK